MAEDQLERVYTIPIRKTTVRVPRRRRAERAVTCVRDFIARHMKADPDRIWIDGPVNEHLWSRGIEKPPAKIRVRAIKFEDGVVEVSLPEE